MDVVRVPIDSIKPHPKNYRGHPPEQIDHIRASLRQYGQYRPIVVSRDGYILAGEGVWTGCKAEGMDVVETVPQPFDHTDTRAEKLLVLDNEVSRAAIDDDKALATLLASIQQTEGLEGTGWDDGGLDKLIGGLAATDYARSQAPLDYTPRNDDDQAGAGSAWGAMATSERVRLVWGDIECALDGELYDAVKARLDAAFDGGGSYQIAMAELLNAGCAACA